MKSIMMLMIGNQGETKKTIYETLSYIRNLEPDEVLVKITKVYPGTRLHDIAEKEGIVSDDYYLSNNEIAPSFNCERSTSELESFLSIFKLRNIRLGINGTCNNNCVYCDNTKKTNPRAKKEMKKSLIWLSKRASSITFAGREPTLNKDIRCLIDYARKLDVGNISLETNARMFSYDPFAKAFSNARITSFEIPFFTSVAKIHDSITRVGGSFEQTVAGIKNIIKYHGNNSLVAILRILNQNYKDLDKTITFLISLGVNNFQFTYEPAKGAKLPDLELLRPHLNYAISKLKKRGIKFTVVGVPYCILPDCEDQIDEIHRPFDELLDLGGNLINIGKQRRIQKIKKPKCKGCRYDFICEGFWKHD